MELEILKGKSPLTSAFLRGPGEVGPICCHALTAEDSA